ncbi:glycyl-radical enzyme activating protein [Clostridium sp. CX1]|uniref:Glycyl-radical enzyme activating protein n=1 Tax=Clostridium tanneri TaxID=3037988 RepID=A0ABU4JQP5_9CLOT|nr:MULTISPECIES: trans-4-hydroxy-L-proline dehydratase activase [unclassified Clostridium]MCT8978426.1 glycyl-radical enzyme activating protein [Clostridium sp. CX1]MDW8800457.1 glycyl-radical enzyme activating protein [Clostridium sp. A1-XYC3]
MTSGTVINIQKYSIHDGPGIRTTVFLKGCPLKCWWCHNPESQSLKHEIMFFEERCTGCGSCIKRCPEKAIQFKDSYPVVDENKCKICGKCTDFCPNNAREYVGKDMTAQELMREIIKDEVFYDESNGGVTFSGGEPLIHADFLAQLLKLCKERGIHTAVDTSGYVAWENFEKIFDKVDLFLFDLKHMNNDMHKKYMDVPNDLILENLKKLSDKNCNIFIRMPIIAGVNDDSEHIEKAIEFIEKLNVLQVNLLPYHKMGMDKYRRLKMDYRLSGMEKPSNERMEEIADKFKKSGIRIKIGG